MMQLSKKAFEMYSAGSWYANSYFSSEQSNNNETAFILSPLPNEETGKVLDGALFD